MTKKQRHALQPSLEALKAAFNEAAAQASQSRTWPYRYVAAVVNTYLKIRGTRVGQKRLSQALGMTKRRILLRLIERTTDRNMKMRSRWSRVAWLAIMEKVEPIDIVDWIHDGGGLAGRASQAAQLAKKRATG